EAISSPTRCSSTSVPCAAAWKSSKRLTRPRFPGSRMANSSSTATVKSFPASKASRAERICSSGLSFWASPTRRKYQSGNRLPAPALDRSRARRSREPGPIRARQRQDCIELRGEVRGGPGLERGKRPMLLRVGLLKPLGDLGEPGVSGDERRRPARRCLCGNHDEGLREDGRGHAYVREGPEVAEVAVLEGTGEENAFPCAPLEGVASGPEPDDDGARIHVLERFQ